MVTRIIDANFNRVREALRVVEDIIRFYDNANRKFAYEIRDFRHSFTLSYIKYFGRYAISFRNTKTDIGKTNPSSPAKNIKDILLRNFFRVEEGLRCIEEFSRISNPLSTKHWQKLRFSIYEIEQKVVSEIPEKNIPNRFNGIYFSGISTRNLESTLKEFTDEKLSILIFEPCGSDSEMVRNLKKIKTLFEKKLILIVNRFDIALAADIDGIHLEPGSLKTDIVRRFMPGKIIGMTLSKEQKLKKSDEKRINYVACDWLSEKNKLLTDCKKNIKLYIAAILYSRQKIDKTIKNAVDGVIIKCCKTDETEILGIKKMLGELNNGKKT